MSSQPWNLFWHLTVSWARSLSDRDVLLYAAKHKSQFTLEDAELECQAATPECVQGPKFTFWSVYKSHWPYNNSPHLFTCEAQRVVVEWWRRIKAAKISSLIYYTATVNISIFVWLFLKQKLFGSSFINIICCHVEILHISISYNYSF